MPTKESRAVKKQPVASLTLAAFAAITFLCQGLARADERVVSRSLKALDAFCISTQLDRQNLDAEVQLYQHRELERDALKIMSLYNLAGYAVVVDNSSITVTLGRRESEDEISRNCTVTIKDLAFADATNLLRSKHSAEEVGRFTHGLSKMAVYRAALPGYAADMFFSVQSGGGITALSFFEKPRTEVR